MKRIKNISLTLAGIIAAALVISSCSGVRQMSKAAEEAFELTVTPVATEMPDSTAQYDEPDTSVASDENGESEEIDTSGITVHGIVNDGFYIGDLFSGGCLKDAELIVMENAADAGITADESLIINNANSFYYYEQLDADQQALYDAMLEVSKYPDREYVTKYSTTMDPSSDEFDDYIRLVFDAMIMDHPELFWLDCSETTGIVYPYSEPDEQGNYTVFFALYEPYEQYEEEMTAFNNAADEYMAGFDLNVSEMEIARQIHDKLIADITYANYVAEEGYYQVDNYAHTAYDALVCDSNGNPHYAVCDGYVFGFEYLMQQAGIQAIGITGQGGTTEDIGNHSWNMAYLDGKWYEIDLTMDDPFLPEELFSPGENAYDTVIAAYNDPEFYDHLTHYMFCLNTSEFNHFHPDDSYTYTYNNNRVNFIMSDVVHERDSESGERDRRKALMELAPIAE